MSAPCDQCRQPLDRCAVLNDVTVCTDCAIRALKAARRGTRAVVVTRSPVALRDAAQAVATAAHPDDRAKVDAAIRTLAATGQPFSANSARELHGVSGGVVGAAFTAARKAGLIRACGDDTSSKGNTHGHRIFQWVGVAA